MNTGDEVEPIARTNFTQAIGEFDSIWLLVEFEDQKAWIYGAFVRIHSSRIPNMVANYPAPGPLQFDFNSEQFVYGEDGTPVPASLVPASATRSLDGSSIAWVATWNYTYKDTEWEEMRDVYVQRNGNPPVVVRVPNTPEENSREYRLQLSPNGEHLALFGGIGPLDQVVVVNVDTGQRVAEGALRDDLYGQQRITMYDPARRYTRDQFRELLDDDLRSVSGQITILQDRDWLRQSLGYSWARFFVGEAIEFDMIEGSARSLGTTLYFIDVQ